MMTHQIVFYITTRVEKPAINYAKNNKTAAPNQTTYAAEFKSIHKPKL